jgi:leucyl aminopeptidase
LLERVDLDAGMALGYLPIADRADPFSGERTMPQPELIVLEDAQEALAGGGFDSTVLVFCRASDPMPPVLRMVLGNILPLDLESGRSTTLHCCPEAAGGRLVLAPTGPLDRDWDDVRSVAEAAASGVVRAKRAGSVRPAIVLAAEGTGRGFSRRHSVALLGALQALWEPLEARENDPAIESVAAVGLLASPGQADAGTLSGIECGRRLARDLCGTHAERMTPLAFASYCEESFAGSAVKVTVIDDLGALQSGYPLMMAVARASVAVPRHRPCVLRLEYRPESAPKEHLMLAGKGVTYDTGGADLKTGGHMAGMSRDKGGAAAAAGIVRAAAALGAPIAVTAEIGLVRNSIGADSFVTDEIITSHAGVRVRIGNTDAEGRLVLADCLSQLRLRAAASVAPSRLFSLATLTGHAALAVGPYTILMGNGPACRLQVVEELNRAGEEWGEPMERSFLRREDIAFVDARTSASDLLSCNSAPSSRTPRGHQFPMAFLLRASGLDSHGSGSSSPIPYTHVDLAGSGVEGGDWAFGKPTAAPVLSFAARWML